MWDRLKRRHEGEVDRVDRLFSAANERGGAMARRAHAPSRRPGTTSHRWGHCLSPPFLHHFTAFHRPFTACSPSFLWPSGLPITTHTEVAERIGLAQVKLP